jgi:hypothetical protein
MARINPLKLAAASVAMFTLLMVFAIQRIPVPAEPIVVAAVAAEQRFDAAWQDTVAVIPPTKKADRLQIASTEPKVTERVPPAPSAPVSMPPVILVQDEDKPPASRHRRQRAESDVCAKHHLHKVATRGGRSWRCRK